MNLKYSYWWFKSALPPEVCDAIIERGLEELYSLKNEFGIESTYGTTGDHRHKDSINMRDDPESVSADAMTVQQLKRKKIDPDKVYVRDSQVSWLNDKWIFDAIRPLVQQANQQAGWNWHWDFIESLQFTKYGLNQFYGWHADSTPIPYEMWDRETVEPLKDKDGNIIKDIWGKPVPPDGHYTENPDMAGKIRKLSVTINLVDSEKYRGGNLRFDFGPHADKKRFHTCTEIRPRGSVIVFPSFVYHQVTPVTFGTRYSLVAWCLGKPFV